MWPGSFCTTPSNFRTECDLESYLKEQGVPGLCGVDTRELTRIIRENGVMNAAICDHIPSDLTPLETYAIQGAVEQVTRRESTVYPAVGEERSRVVLVDYGVKNSILQALRERGCTVTAVPAATSAEDILAMAPDGVLLSNGPGDPAEDVTDPADPEAAGQGAPVRHRIGPPADGAGRRRQDRPAEIRPHGRQPAVRDLKGVRTYITSQNHGYAVDGESVKNGVVGFVNANDGTCEG